jgi:hypothetical protein
MPPSAKKIKINRPPILFKDTQKTINSIKKNLDGDFISYWISNNSRIASEDTISLFEILKEKSPTSTTLNLFIKSNGGSGEGSLRIVNLLRKFYKTIIAIVPLDCASAATILALGADKIMMGPLAYLSAIDTSIVHSLSPVNKYNDRVSVSQNELSRVLSLWNDQKQTNDLNPYNELYKHIHPLVFGAVDRSTSLSIKLTTEVLSYHMKDPKKASKISNHLNSQYPSHSYPITMREAKKIGLKVAKIKPKINDLLLKLNLLYSEMAQLAYTDFDEQNYHDNEILKLIEGQNMQLLYQKDKDWHYRSDEKIWIPMNDESSWRKNILLQNGQTKWTKFHIQ